MNKISIEKYLLNASSYWPESHYRNVKKIERFLERGCNSKKNEKVRRYVKDIIALAELRLKFKTPHLYIVNAGSSGSHWLEAMLGFLPGFHNGGEIYLPAEIKKSLKAMGEREAHLFLDALYLVHCGEIFPDMLSAALSNSAHLANHQQLSSYSRYKKTVLLLRDPVDIVMSRTFRKDEYKNDVALGMADIDYLEKNCAYFENFYKNIDFDSFDVVVRYEELKCSPLSTLRSLISAVGLSASDDELVRAVDLASEETAKKAIEKGEVPVTNIYLDKKEDVSWAKSYIITRLENIRSELSYS